MKIVKAIPLYISLFLFLLIFFSPKAYIYYTLEHYLKKEQKIIFSDESVHDRGFSLTLTDIKLYYNGVYAGDIKNITLNSFIFYNSLDIENALLNSALANFLPRKLEHLSFSYSIINPLKIKIDGYGDIGTISGYINLFERAVHIAITKKEKLKYKMLLRKFREKEGVLVYEFRY